MPDDPTMPASITTDEFLDWPKDDAGTAWQLVDGQPAMMAPHSAIHSLVQANLATLLNVHLWEARRGYAALTGASLLPRVLRDVNIRVPDLIVHGGKMVRGQMVLEHPVLVVEIFSLSHSAQTWSNIWTYCTMPSVQEILIVRTASVRAEILRRSADGSWPEDFQPCGETLRLDSIDFKCPLVRAYRGTELADV